MLARPLAHLAVASTLIGSVAAAAPLHLQRLDQAPLVGHVQKQPIRRAAPRIDLKARSMRQVVKVSAMGGRSYAPGAFTEVTGTTTNAWSGEIAGVENGDTIKIYEQHVSAPVELHALRLLEARLSGAVLIRAGERFDPPSVTFASSVQIRAQRESGADALTTMVETGHQAPLRTAVEKALRWQEHSRTSVSMPAPEFDALGQKTTSGPFTIAERSGALQSGSKVRVEVTDPSGAHVFSQLATVGKSAPDWQHGISSYSRSIDRSGNTSWYGIRPEALADPSYEILKRASDANRHVTDHVQLELHSYGGGQHGDAPWVQTRNVFVTPAFVKGKAGVARIVGLAAVPAGTKLAITNRTLQGRNMGNASVEVTADETGSFEVEIPAPAAGLDYGLSLGGYLSGMGPTQSYAFKLPDPAHAEVQHKGVGFYAVALEKEDMSAR